MLPVTQDDQRATCALITQVARREPQAITFTRDSWVERSIAAYLVNHQYFTLLLVYGHTFTLALLHLFADAQEYERCSQIKQAIDRLNTMGDFNLPTQ